MADLTATFPAAGLVPVEIGGALLDAAAPASIWAIAPYRGCSVALSAALEQIHGLPYPVPGRCHDAGASRIAWSGLDQAVLIAATPDTDLARHAALCDQSDGWAHLALEGATAREVLARLVPLDLSPRACPPGSARRSLLGHLPALILHPGGDRFEILVYRSMAESAVHDLTRAMRSVAARAAI